MNLRLFTVDAFTKTPFNGNPAAVIPLDQVSSQICNNSCVSSFAGSEMEGGFAVHVDKITLLLSQLFRKCKRHKRLKKYNATEAMVYWGK